MHNHFARWFSRNQKAVDAFLKRKTAGMNLSQRVWQYVDNLKVEMETALSISLGQGDSAATVSRKVRKYLNNPDDMFRRFRYKKGEDEDGNAVYGRKWKRKYIDKTTGKVTWKDFNPGDYHTGKGVYRSAYKNAMRMTRTEINMAYRTADQDRWGRMDFVVGYRVKRSNNHPSTDICDDLSAANGDNSSSRGVYPKSFVFKGWHPQCRCFVVPIMASRTDFVRMQQALLNGEDVPQPSGKIEEPNEYFNKWVSKNKDRIESAGTLPYWVKDNKKAVEKAIIDKSEGLKAASKSSQQISNLTADGILGNISKSKAAFDEYDKSIWSKDCYSDEDNGGFYVSHKDHNFEKEGGGGRVELIVGKMLAKKGKHIEFLPEVRGQLNPDMAFDWQTWDVKFTEKANESTMRKYIKNATKADNAIFYFGEAGNSKIKELTSAINRQAGDYSKKNKLYKMPNIYVIDDNGNMRRLFKRP